MKIVGTKEGVDKARHIVQTISDEQVYTYYYMPIVFLISGVLIRHSFVHTYTCFNEK